MIRCSKLAAQAGNQFYYLASPYTHDDPAVRAARAHAVKDYAGIFMKSGVYVYAAIWATHHISLEHTLPVEFERWLGHNKAFIDASAGVIVCKIPGWDASRGVAQEIGYAVKIGRPVFFAESLAPDTLKITVDRL